MTPENTKELIEILDTAVKIGLGAIVSGYISCKLFNLKNTAETNRLEKIEKRDLIMKIALTFEDVESKIDSVEILVSHSEIKDACLSLAQALESTYKVRAYANILGNTKMVDILNSMASKIESLYSHIVNTGTTTSLSDEIASLADGSDKGLLYPLIREEYAKTTY